MILTIDAGNTTVSAAAFDSGSLVSIKKISTDRSISAEKAVLELRSAFDGMNITGAILSSVVPEIDNKVIFAVDKVFGCRTVLLSPELDTGISLSEYAGGNLGMDRLADMAGAMQLVGTPVMVFDLGTCTTASVLGEDGSFLGGMISPGIQTSLNAMHEHTSKLPSLKAESPSHILGLDTPECMMSGTVIGTAAMIDGLASRVEAELGRSLPVVLTGGTGSQVLPWLNRHVLYKPDLIFYGLLRIYEMNNAL